jgi:catalase
MQTTAKESIQSRRIAVLAAPGLDAAPFDAVRIRLEGAGAHLDVIASGLGVVPGADGTLLPVDKHALAASSVMYDAVLVPGGASAVATLMEQPLAVEFVAEAYRHAKPIGAIGKAVDLLQETSVPHSSDPVAMKESEGVIVGSPASLDAFADAFIEAIKQHRFPLGKRLLAEAPLT